MRWTDLFKIRRDIRLCGEADLEQQALKNIEQGNALENKGSFAQAMQCYNIAVSLAPNLARAHMSRGNILLATETAESALEAYATALVHDPEYAAAYYNVGNAHLHLNQPREALIAYTRSVELKPDFADAHLALGCVLVDMDRLPEAELCYHRALDAQPNYSEVHSNLGKVLNDQGRFDEAIASFKRALESKPGCADAHYTLGGALMTVGKTSEATLHFEQAIELDEFHSPARWALAMAQIRPIYDDIKGVEDSRINFKLAIAALEAWFTPSRAALGVKAVGSKHPFYLAYQARDNRMLLEAYSSLCARLMSTVTETVRYTIQPAPHFGRKLRIGIVSAHVWNHSVWIAVTRGWIQHLNPARFEVLIFHLSRFSDEETLRARREATDFIDKPRTLVEWSQAIVDAQVDVLIFPEIGMDRLTTQLAAERLAPVQATSWGHPQTSGLPTIDLFLSADLFEPPSGDVHYSEKLIRLPNLGACVEPLSPRVVDPDMEILRLPIDEPLLLCPGVPFKYQPEDDDVLVSLSNCLRTHGKGRLVFFGSHHATMTLQFEQRLRRAFDRAGADFDRTVCFIPTLPREQFYGLMRNATLMLDTIEFSGFNTALQGIECTLPVVAYEGAFMRGRLASGLLHRIGLHEWVAKTKADFIAKAMRLVVDEPLRLELRQQIAKRRAILFNDLEPVRALERVLSDAVAHAHL